MKHELYAFTLTSPEGTWDVCANCVEVLVVRLTVADAEAGEMLEEMWQRSAEP